MGEMNKIDEIIYKATQNVAYEEQCEEVVSLGTAKRRLFRRLK